MHHRRPCFHHSHGPRRDVYRAPAERLFGFELGWFDSDEWSREPRALCAQAVGDARQVMITTDAWLVQDHRTHRERLTARG